MKVPRNPQGKSKRIPTISASTTSFQTANCIYYFGSFSLNEAEQQLLRNGEPVRLAPKAFDLLLVLIQNRGCLVTKKRLLEEVWPDAFVEEANLSVNVAILRKALDEGDDQWRCIETVSKRGYRFVAPVSEVTDENTGVEDQIDALINKVQAFINNGSLTASQRQALIDAANAIKASLGGIVNLTEEERD